MAKIFYKGFSTKEWGKKKSFRLNNIDLVKQDLLNHLYTEKGSRIYMPNLGTRIPVMTFEPNDLETKEQLESDIRDVINYDPRVKLLGLKTFVAPDNNLLIAIVDILYIEFNVEDSLHIEIPRG